MRVVVAGASGLIGSALVSSLRSQGHEVLQLVRRAATNGEQRQWNPAAGTVDEGTFTGADAVVNLGGAGIGDKRWSGSRKQEIRDSRLAPTDVLARAVAREGVPVFLSASAVGYYGDTGPSEVTERSPAGGGFLAEVCVDWEEATAPAAEAGARVARLRTGLVLAPHGGLLGKLRPLYKLALGGRLGDGKQYYSWISLADEVAAMTFVLENSAVSGPVNLTGPEPVTNAEFNGALGRALGRPAPWVVPGFAIKALIGEFGQEGVLAGQRVRPTVLEAAGYRFQHPTVEAALHYACA